MLTADQVELARRYAHAYFFRSDDTDPEGAPSDELLVCRGSRARLDLQPGADPYLDLICDRILDGEPLHTPRDLVLEQVPFPDL